MPVELSPDQQGVVRLRGALDFATVPDLHRATDDLLRDRDTLVIDVSAVERANSAGVALLLEWLAEARRRGCTLSFRGLPESVLAVARLSGAEHLLTGHPLPLE
jgi:phospholipid transport system transporter-binding protein